MPFRCDMRFETWVRTRVDCIKKHAPYHLRHWNWWLMSVFFQCWLSNHMLVGGVSVNSLCQQGGPFALSVNRHSVIFAGNALKHQSVTFLVLYKWKASLVSLMHPPPLLMCGLYFSLSSIREVFCSSRHVILPKNLLLKTFSVINGAADSLLMSKCVC